ncbi:MAG TPA: hypothetical protein VFV42_02400 [Acidimicrobiales bacterium]|nr:hypothetical protein [Acidimicrobiales bacterium]
MTGDPDAVLRSWAQQLAPLGMGDVLLRAGEPLDALSAWGEIGVQSGWVGGSPGPGWVDVQLWATEGEPILLVSIDRFPDVDRVESTVVDDGGSLEPPPDPSVGARPPAPGDELFDEGSDVIHVPEGARALMPSIPTTRGTGGSTSLLAATDERAVIQRMLDEAVAQNEYHEVSPVEVEEQDEVTVTKGRFVVPAGGWEFQVVAVRVLGEPDAMVWVQSAAD